MLHWLSYPIKFFSFFFLFFSLRKMLEKKIFSTPSNHRRTGFEHSDVRLIDAKLGRPSYSKPPWNLLKTSVCMEELINIQLQWIWYFEKYYNNEFSKLFIYLKNIRHDRCIKLKRNANSFSFHDVTETLIFPSIAC